MFILDLTWILDCSDNSLYHQVSLDISLTLDTQESNPTPGLLPWTLRDTSLYRQASLDSSLIRRAGDMVLVLVCYSFQYTARDGRLVTIRPNESYTLVSRTNQHWWCVRSDPHTRPFFVPAQYVTEVQSASWSENRPKAAPSSGCSLESSDVSAVYSTAQHRGKCKRPGGHEDRPTAPLADHEDLEFRLPPLPHVLDSEPELDPDPSQVADSELHDQMTQVLCPEPVSSPPLRAMRSQQIALLASGVEANRLSFFLEASPL